LRLRSFAGAHPYWFVVLLEFAIVVVYLVAGTVAHLAHLGNLGLYGIAQAGLTMVAVALLSFMGWWKTVGFRAPDEWSDLYYFALPFLPVVINVIPGLQVSSLGYLGRVLAITLMVGFVEEVFFRGLMLTALRSRGLWRTAIITALLFGLTHALNVLAGKSAMDAAAQIFYATAIGFAYAALVLKKHILWPLVIAHFVIDFANFIQRPGFTYPPAWTLAIVVGTGVVFAAYGAFVMLRVPETIGAAVPGGGTSGDRIERTS
jgi:uncharacterized protein